MTSQGATAMYHKALALALPQATASHPNEQAPYSSADSYAEFGEAEAILATVRGQSRRNQIAHGTRPIPDTRAAWEFGMRSKNRGR
jgi:hypothetical protein